MHKYNRTIQFKYIEILPSAVPGTKKGGFHLLTVILLQISNLTYIVPGTKGGGFE